MMAYAEQSELTETEAVGVSPATVADYFALLKPRVMSLVVFTALTAMAIAPGGIHPVLGFASLLAIAVGAGAAGALNMWYDADIDRLMRRTRGRPIPMQRVTPGEALAFGLTLAAGAVTVLGFAANYLAAGLLAFTIFFYVAVYTMWLKRRTPQNIVIGGAAGALPPVIAWTAVTGSIGWESLILFAIIFLWTPPHFWALALYKADEYERAGVPMLPVVAGVARTRREILLYSVVLALAGLAPAAFGFAGIGYGAIAALAGIAFVALAVRVCLGREGAGGERTARDLFAYSILYLFLLFAVLLAEAIGSAGVGA
jgi:protoheme IX farnesyltransferase